jgi:hypothetical protein
MKYWICVKGSNTGPHTSAEIINNFGTSLPSDTPCAIVGEHKWSTLGLILPEIGTAPPTCAPPFVPEPTPYADAMANAVIHKIIAIPIFIITGLIAAPIFNLYDKTNNRVYGLLFFAVIVIGISASIIIPHHVISASHRPEPRSFISTIPLIGRLFLKVSAKRRPNPFISEK